MKYNLSKEIKNKAVSLKKRWNNLSTPRKVVVSSLVAIIITESAINGIEGMHAFNFVTQRYPGTGKFLRKELVDDYIYVHNSNKGLRIRTIVGRELGYWVGMIYRKINED